MRTQEPSKSNLTSTHLRPLCASPLVRRLFKVGGYGIALQLCKQPESSSSKSYHYTRMLRILHATSNLDVKNRHTTAETLQAPYVMEVCLHGNGIAVVVLLHCMLGLPQYVPASNSILMPMQKQLKAVNWLRESRCQPTLPRLHQTGTAGVAKEAKWSVA